MIKHSYRAYDKSGAKFEGEIAANSRADVIAQLHQKGLIPAEVKEIKQAAFSGALFQSNKVGLADLEFLTSELSLLLRSGVRIVRGIDIIHRNKAKPALANLLHDINQQLKSGNSLSDAVRSYPDIFDNLYCNLIELGESSGTLSETFADLAKNLKFQRELRRKVIGSLMYPLVIFFVCLLSIVFIFNFIIPRMSVMFDGVDNLPWYTSALIKTSEWMSNYQGALFIGLIGAAFGGYKLFKQPSVKRRWQRMSLSIPVVKTFVTTVERIRFNSGLAMTLSAGVAIDKALKLSIGNLTNEELKRELQIATDKVSKGTSLSEALGQSVLYPGFFVSLLEVGEESGSLEEVFDEIATRSRQEFESWTERMISLLEPLMIIFMGGIVGGIVIVMLLSMVSVNEIGF